jgi:MFS family permease
MGVARALQTPAQQAIVPALVPIAQLARAMALSSAVMKVAVVAGPALGGFIYVAGAPWAYGLCVLFLIAAFVCALSIHHVPLTRGKEPPTFAAMFAGFGFIFHKPVVLGAISLDLFAVVLGGATALLPIYAKDILQVGPTGLGWLAAAMPAGACLMAIAQGHLPPSKRAGARFLWAVAGFGVATVVFGLSTNFWLSLAALAAIGALDNISVVTRQTVVQSHTPDALRGWVSSVNSVFISTSNELGAFESGLVAALTTPVFAVASGGVATVLLVAAGAKVFPELRRMKSLTQSGA